MADRDQDDYDDEPDDDDTQTYLENGAESQMSLASDITHYRYENGRRYHAYRDGQYWGPNDDKATQNEIVAHHLFLLALDDKLFLAPIHDPTRVIDVGTGTGIWAQDFADQFPSADVIGTDLSRIQPDFTPPNLRFDIDDCCSTWTYPPDYFDFIHVRCMYGSVADWPGFFKECYDHLQPGGYIEQAEISACVSSDEGHLTPGSQWDQNNRYFLSASEASGRTLMIQEKLKELIEHAGFVDVVEHRFKWPIGAWSQDPKLREVGKWNQHRCGPMSKSKRGLRRLDGH
ncbi:hypothetical protein MMC06_000105 [Schaereria dolodes]|nr:hypothetical protein [Schaereria dolodes]